MTTDTLQTASAPPRDTDRNAILVLLGLIWLGVLMGFGGEILREPTRVYLPIVHVHAAVFVGWLVLVTVQVLLVRKGDVALHRRLGLLGAAVAGVMVVLGPATAIVVDAAKFAAKGRAPIFLSVQFADMLAFTTLVGAGLLLRARPDYHRRLMLLGTLFISDAGSSRWLGDSIQAAMGGDGFWPFWGSLYLPNVVLLLVFGAYEFATRRRLHPAFVIGSAWFLLVQLGAVALFFSPAWKPISLKLIGQ
jgi:hypothetical protein